MTVWSPQQAAALDTVGRWLADPAAPQVFRLFGYAGTGKTTLARHLTEHCKHPIFAAYTGKAASVLREKGCPNAQTLHSLMYSVSARSTAKLDELRAQLKALEPSHPDRAELNADVKAEEDRCRRPWFYPNPDSKLQWADLLVCDEVSMVDARIGKDMLSFGKKILVLGDPAQLPPVTGGGFFTNQKPDILLTEIHRQAADDPILKLATMAREGVVIPFGDYGARARKFTRASVTDEWLARNAGQLLCGKNDTRFDLNKRVRAVYGRTSILPSRKDTLVMLQNDYRLGVLNGTIGTAICDALLEPGHDNPATASHFWLNILYEKKILQDIKISAAAFTGAEPRMEHGVLQADYGYALTVHKAQGSQWPTVTIYDDGFGKRSPMDRRRWLYTAITRAEHTLNIVTS